MSDSNQTLNEQLTELNQLVGLLSHDITSLNAGTKRSAVDARKRLSSLSKLSTKMRAECLKVQKAIPTKSRKKKSDVETVTDGVETLDVESSEEETAPVPKKKGRGRPKKAV